MPPPYLLEHTFLGRRCEGGVNPLMQAVLLAVEADLQGQYAAAPPPVDGGPQPPFEEWCGLHENPGAWRPPPGGRHESGSAVDLNYTTNPYIATRSGAQLGGEACTTYTGLDAAGNQVTITSDEARSRAVAAYDNAVRFAYADDQTSDTSVRVNDSIEVTYDRFRRVSDALVFYFSFALTVGTTTLKRTPRLDVPGWADQSAEFDTIPADERMTETDSRDFLEGYLASPEFIAAHPTWSLDATGLYYQILRDYESVRVPQLIGNPRNLVTVTRNPAKGFLDLRRELVTTFVNVGNQVLTASGVIGADGAPLRVRWGASDFGAKASGDVQHFDLADHPAGFPPGA